MNNKLICVMGVLLAVNIIVAAGDNIADETAVTEFNRQSLQCITEIKNELAALSDKYPVFKEIGRTQIHVSKRSSKDIDSYLAFRHHVKYAQFTETLSKDYILPVTGAEIPEVDGVRLDVGMREFVFKIPTTIDYRVICGTRTIKVYYYLRLGKDVEGLREAVGAVIENRLKSFCDVWHGQEHRISPPPGRLQQ